MKNTSFVLSNEPCSIPRRQTLMNVKVFKVHTTRNKDFSRILNRVHPQRDKKKIPVEGELNGGNVEKIGKLPARENHTNVDETKILRNGNHSISTSNYHE